MLLLEDNYETRLYPEGGRGNEDNENYGTHSYHFGAKNIGKGTSFVSAIGIKTDWHIKRPTHVNVYKRTYDGNCMLLAERKFSRLHIEQTNNICGVDYNSRCHWPNVNESARAQMTIPLEPAVPVGQGETIELEAYGVFVKSGSFAIIQGSRIFGIEGATQELVPVFEESGKCPLANSTPSSFSTACTSSGCRFYRGLAWSLLVLTVLLLVALFRRRRRNPTTDMLVVEGTLVASEVIKKGLPSSYSARAIQVKKLQHQIEKQECEPETILE